MWLMWAVGATYALSAWLVVIRLDLPNTTALGIIYALVLVVYALLIRAVTLGRNWTRFTYSGLAIIAVGSIVWTWLLGGLTSTQRLIGGWADHHRVFHCSGLLVSFKFQALVQQNKGTDAVKLRLAVTRRARAAHCCRSAEARMLWLLLMGIVMCAALAASACNRSTTAPAPNAGGQSVKPVLELTGDPPVSVRSVKVTGAMSRADALAGLQEALPHLQQAAKQSEAEGKTPSGSFVASFVTEPDGMIRMMMEGESRLTGGKPAGVVEGLSSSTMSNKWRFPASGGQTIIETEFVVGQP